MKVTFPNPILHFLSIANSLGRGWIGWKVDRGATGGQMSLDRGGLSRLCSLGEFTSPGMGQAPFERLKIRRRQAKGVDGRVSGSEGRDARRDGAFGSSGRNARVYPSCSDGGREQALGEMREALGNEGERRGPREQADRLNGRRASLTTVGSGGSAE